MKKLILLISLLSVNLFAGGSYSLTMIYVGKAIIDPVLSAQMSEIENIVDDINKGHNKDIYEQIVLKNKELKKLYKMESLALLEQKRLQNLDEKILIGEKNENAE